jgi:uncharacterized protein with FMN-binding domain
MSSKTAKVFMALFSFALALSLGACSSADIKDLTVTTVTPASVRDGTYLGECATTLVSAKVEVAVKDSAIKAIKVLEHSHGPGHGADAIVDRVIAAQSLQVDAVSGSTRSSKVMLKAIENALEKGL